MLSSSYFLRLLAFAAISSKVALSASVDDTTSVSQTSPGYDPFAPFCTNGHCAKRIHGTPSICCYTTPPSPFFVPCITDADCADAVQCGRTTFNCPVGEDNGDNDNDD